MTGLTEKRTYSFSGFELDAERRTLARDGEKIALNSKTFDLLLTLIEHRGRVLSKDELLDKVWTGQFVEENNLTVHISALRKALGERKGEHRFLVTRCRTPRTSLAAFLPKWKSARGYKRFF